MEVRSDAICRPDRCNRRMAMTTSGRQRTLSCTGLEYISYPANCVARPGVRLVARPVARVAARPGIPTNRGGPVDRVGRR